MDCRENLSAVILFNLQTISIPCLEQTMQINSRLIHVYCVVSVACECEMGVGESNSAIHLATDSQTYADQVVAERNADPFVCSKCGQKEVFSLSQVDYHRKHFTYKD